MLFPVKKNVIQMRIENIGDHLDENLSADKKVYTVDVLDIAQQLFADVNGDLSNLSYVNIREMSLTGN